VENSFVFALRLKFACRHCSVSVEEIGEPVWDDEVSVSLAMQIKITDLSAITITTMDM
jgi:hypothetical protein